MNFSTKPFSAKVKAILMGCSSGRAISGIESSFLMNFGIEGAAYLFPIELIRRLKVSSEDIGRVGGGYPPPSALMVAGEAAALSNAREEP